MKKRRAKQLEFSGVSGWGGKRPRAGRVNRSGTVHHMRRETVDFRKPLHVTLSVTEGHESLRSRALLQAFQKSCKRAKDFGLHVIHYALVSNHLHMIVEARDNSALGRGMRSLAGSFAKAVKKLQGDSLPGRVFSGRYHLRVIKNPSQMKRTLEYVLLNVCKHRRFLEHMDPYSSARYFPHWRRLLGSRWNDVISWEMEGLSQKTAEVGLSPPRSWLASRGWLVAARTK